MIEGTWQSPFLTEGFKPRIGSSFVEEFVAAHSASDVLRELVQNEFDAGGTQMSVTFGMSELTVIGNGRPIDAKGWSRLDVILGTGQVVGGKSEDNVEAKENGIGSKNFGLRSLFLFGNRIHVRSNGRMAVLDLPAMGTQNLEDPSSRGRRGVSIHVPYRSEPFHSLAAFTSDWEQQALDQLEDGLFSTLVKLALPGVRPGIRELTLVSERTGRAYDWRQRAETVKCKVKSVTAVRRIGRFRIVDPTKPDGARLQIFEEMEFSRPVAIPPEHAGARYPAYYRGSDGALRVCVSLPTRRGKIERARPGHFYYPLQTPQGSTGAAVSVSAPFKLDADRTSLLPNSAWNDWLADQAARLAQDLLSTDWLRRFGADGYLATNATWPAAPERFSAKIAAHFRETACWPTQDFLRNGSLAKASDIVIPDETALDGFASGSSSLDRRLAASKEVLELVLRYKARRFTLNSLVRLRCAGADASKLATKLGEKDSDLHYTNYDAALAGAELQHKMASTITTLNSHLSNQNRKDLKETASTLAADGSLRAADALVRVDKGFWEVCPEPLVSRLHPILLDQKGVAGLCRPFAFNTWIMEAAGRAGNGKIEESERNALYQHLLAEGAKLGRKALAAVRRSPVVLDQRGEWVAPANLAQLPATEAKLLDAVISAPSPALAKRTELLRRLHVRRKLAADDLIRFATRIGDDTALALRFEELLNKHPLLLVPKVIASLRTIPLLRSRRGTLLAPERLHLPTAANLACLDSDEAIVTGSNSALYRRLGCRQRPSADTLRAVLQRLKVTASAPARPDILYPTLVAVLTAEKRSPTAYANEPILWVERAYSSPTDTLIGASVPRIFRQATPVFHGPDAVANAYEALGASRYPRDQHWIKLFQSLGQPSGAQERAVVPEPVQHILREAYRLRGNAGLPDGLDPNVRCVLSRDGRLYSLQELRDAAFVEDDYPPLAEALSQQGAKIAFADIVEGSRPFFSALRLGRLSSVCGEARIDTGPPCAPPGWFRPAHLTKMTTLFQLSDFAVALGALAWAHQRQVAHFQAPQSADLNQRLVAIGQLQFVSTIERVYRVRGVRARVQGEAAAMEDRIVLKPARSLSELEQMLAHTLAELLGATRLTDVRTLALSVLPLLRCRTRGDMLAYLERQGAVPQEWMDVQPELAGTQADEETADAAEEIVREIVGTLDVSRPTDSDRPISEGSMPVRPETPTSVEPSEPFTLPPLDEVRVAVAATANAAIVRPVRTGASGAGWGGGWSPPSSRDVERDRMVGDRGEELVYRLELERLREIGHPNPESLVVWTSRSDPGADHDIRSIAADGKPLWIEVKSTTGRDGAFLWPRAEFEKAMREGDHYELWRVYEVDSLNPTAKAFRDPAALLRISAVRLELSTLRAFVEPKES